MRSIALLATLVLAPLGAVEVNAAEDGPFGLQSGAPLSSYDTSPLEDPGLYAFNSVPKPHPSFDTYRGIFHSSTGLCQIQAGTPIVTTNVYGSKAIQEFDALVASISTRYGKSERFDFLMEGSIWSEPGDWTMALKKDERKLQVWWDKESGSTVPDDIESIQLKAIGLSRDAVFFMLNYRFTNFDTCIAAIDADAASAF